MPPPNESMTDGPLTLPTIVSPRTASMVLAAFPWRSDIIMGPFSISQALQEHPATKHNVFLEKYASSVGEYEKRIRSRSSTEAAGLWNALEIRPGVMSTPVNHEKDKANRFHLVCALRLLDFTAKLNGYTSTLHVPRHLRSTQLTTSCAKFRTKLENWVQLAREFKNCMESASVSQSPLGTADEDVRIRLLKAVLQTNNMHGAANVLHNFNLAAIYLIYVGRNEAWGAALPDMPNNTHDLVSVVTQNVESNTLNANFTAVELEALKHAFKGLTAAHLRLPINIAVMITPLILLLPLKISSWSWNKSDMLQASFKALSKQLGNTRPDVLAKLEEAVMVTLTDIATGKKDTFNAVQRLAQSVNLEELDRCDAEVAQWFSAGPPGASSKSASLLQMDLERPLDPAWPLAAEMEAEFGAEYRIQGQSQVRVPQQQDNGPECETGLQPLPALPALDSAGSQPEDEDEAPSLPPGEGQDEQKEVDQNEQKEVDQNEQKEVDQIDLPKRVSKPVLKIYERYSATASKKRPRARTKRGIVKKELMKDTLGQPALTLFGPGSVNYNPIDVDELWAPMGRPDLSLTGSTQRYKADFSFLMYGPAGQTVAVKPIAHTEKHLTQLRSFYQEMQGTYTEGLPLHLAGPDLSVYKVMTQAQFDALSVREVQNILRTQHLVLTDVPERLAFDEKGLRTMRSVSNTISIQGAFKFDVPPAKLSADATWSQDLSILVSDSHNIQLKEGTLQNLIDAANDPNGKILNALDFPMPWAGWYPNQTSTEIIAWRSTQGMPFAKEGSELPVAHYRFGLAATEGATTWWHIDGPFGTTLTVMAGAKILYTARPINLDSTPPTPQSFDSFARLGIFGEKNFNMEAGFNPLWQVEGIFLPAGTTFIMRPNTPHCAYTSEHAIVYGSHFWCNTTMKDSAYGIIHSFVSSDLIAKTQHPGSRTMIQRIIMFYHRAFVENALKEDDPDREHLPVLTKVDDAINFMSIVIQGIFLNVLDHRTYELPPRCDTELHERFDVNGLSFRQRQAYVYVRSLAYQLLRWFSEFHSFTGQGGLRLHGWTDIVLPYILRQALAILQYKSESKDEGIPGATDDTVRIQMVACLQLLPDVFALVNGQGPPPDDFACTMDREILIAERSDQSMMLDIDKNWGMTPRDKLFFGYTDAGGQEFVDDNEISESEEQNDLPPPRKKSKL